MALPAGFASARFARSNALTAPTSNTAKCGHVNPNQSLGGFRAAQMVNILSTLTSSMTQLGTLFDTTQVAPTAPAGPIVYTSPLVNVGAYQSAATLLHWYRFGYNTAIDGTVSNAAHYGPGTDYAENGGTRLNLDQLRPTTPAAVGLVAADFEFQQPGHFDVQRQSMHLNSGGATDNQAIANTTATTLGIANAWTIGIWARTDTIAAGTSVLFHARASASATTLAANSIRIQRSGADLILDIEDTGGVNRKSRTYTSFFAATTWYHIAITWDGTTLSLYKNGTLTSPNSSTPDDSVTMTDGSRKLLVGGGNNSVNDPTQEWFGHVHSMTIHTNAMSAGEVAALKALGDGTAEFNANTYSHVGDWMVFITGVNIMEARKIVHHNTATGEMRVEQPFPSLGSSGDTYRIGKSKFLFNDGPTVEECSAGLVDYRCIVFYNGAGEQLTDVRFWLKPLDPKNIDLDIVVASDTIGAGALTLYAEDTETPDTKETNFSAFNQSFKRPIDWASARGTPTGSAGGTVNIANNAEHGIWIRRTVSPLHRGGKSAWLLVMEAASGLSSGAGPWRTAVIIMSDPVGFTADFSVAFDRTPRTFGGARVTAHLEDVTSGQPIEGVPTTIELTSGVGSIQAPATQPIETDADGDMQVQYLSSNDDSDAGTSVTVTAHYIGD